ncbi:MAG TPA: hypothetical protein VFR90_09500 [Methylibium sp.]|uniref:glycine-rich domain-containing protein n=1 Tax=Methylibium sp. TaxID=2067992 RepID=UPI002DBE5E42|nr:hypothetical protein [Methylibium sp.]HEU4459343.1 hypothetical protein [Methylibium sp.]
MKWFVLALAGLLLWGCLAHWRRSARIRAIDATPFPRYLRAAVRKSYPALSDRQLADIERGLRQFFHCHRRAKAFVSMPSQAVDAMWHAFILDTRAYERFCRNAFGHFLHHSPAETLGRDAQRNDGLRRTWYHACRLEGIDPRTPAALPLLFALDASLAIAGGFVYVPDCRAIDRQADGGTHCGTSFGDGSSAGSGDSFGGEAGGSDGSGDGGCGGGGD